MTKKINILIIVLIFSQTVFSQFVGRDHLSIALFYMQKNELDSAKKYIDLASEDETLKNQSKTWHYKGYLYKELYKVKEKTNKQSPLRLSSIDAYKKGKVIGYDEDLKLKASKALKYLAQTLYNDAVRSLTPENYKLAISIFDDYRKTMKLSNPEYDFSKDNIKFKMALASMLNKPLENASSKDSAGIVYVKQLYEEILIIDENNPGANYNLATIYYNEAVEKINNMDYDMDILELNKIQDYCIEIFLKGLPYMKKSYDLNYKRKETLLGLSNIYYGLNDVEKSEYYKKELEELEKE